MKKNYIQIYKTLEEKHWFWQTRRKIVIEEVKKLKLESGEPIKDILDIGCGAGYTIKALRGEFNCTGIEPDEYLLKIALENTQTEIIKGNLPDKIPKLKKKFDCILLLDVLEHIEQDKKSLLTIRKLLGDEGYLLINVPAMHWLWSVHDEVNEHKRRYEKKELTRLLTLAGFKIIKINYWCFMLAPFAYLLERRLFKGSKGSYSVFVPPKLINSLLKLYSTFEYYITDNINLPFGLSMFAVAKKHLF